MAELDNLTIKVTADTKEAVASLKQFARSVQTQYTKISSATGDRKKLNKQLSQMFSFDRSSISKEVKKAKDTMQGELEKGNGLNFSNVTDDYLKNIKDISPSVVVALKDIGKGFNDTIPSMQNFNTEATNVIKKLQIISNLAKSYASSISKSSNAYKAFTKTSEQATSKSSDLLGKTKTGGIVETADIIDDAKDKLANATEDMTSTTKRMRKEIEGESGGIKKSFREMFSEKLNSEDMQRKIKALGRDIGKSFVSDCVKGAKAMSQLGKTFFKAITPINAIKPAIDGFKSKLADFERSITRIYKMLRLMILRKILQAGIRGAIDGFKNLVQYSSRTNASVSQLYSSLQELKNALASMLTPLINASANFQGFASVLNTIVQKLIGIVNAINQTLSALVGNNKWIKAKKLNLDYAKSLDKTSKSAKELNRQLQSIDELNVLNSDKDNDSGSNEISPSDMFEEAEIEQRWKDLAEWLKRMWKEGDFTELGQAIGKWLKNALESIPWEKIQNTARKVGKSFATFLNGFVEVEGLAFTIGKTLAEGFNTIIIALNGFVKNIHGVSLGKFIAEFFNGALESIKWDEVYDTFVTGAKELANFINGFNNSLNWENVSDTIGKYVKTMADSIYTFFTSVDWSSLGANIGEQLRRTIEKIDWEGVGRAFGSIIQALFDFIAEFIKKQDVKSVANAIFKFFKGVAEECNLLEVAGIIVGLLSAKLAIKAGSLVSSVAVSALSGALKELILQSFAQKAVGQAVSGGLSNAVAGNAGTMTVGLGSTLATVLQGALGIAVASVGGFVIGKNLAMMIAEGFGDYESVDAYQNFKWSDFFGALNTEDLKGALSELSKDVDEGLNNIVAKFNNGTWKDDVTNALNAIFYEPFDGLKIAVADLFGNDNVMTNVITWFIDLKQEMLDFPLDVWTDINTKLDETKVVFSEMSQSISTHWSEITTKLKSGDISSALSSLKSMFKETFASIVSALGVDVNAIKAKYDELKNKFASTELGQAVTTLKNNVVNGFKTMKTEVLNIIESFKTSLTSKFDSIKNAWSNLKNTLSNGSSVLGGFSIGGYASGGFPTEGQLFLANESGAEMVGSFDGKTAVANNQMIVDGIKQGVYEAMTTQNNILYTQMEYLAEIANKEFGISGNDLFDSVKSSAQSYTNRTGRSAFA